MTKKITRHLATITEGRVRKGGQNTVTQISSRPSAPASMLPKPLQGAMSAVDMARSLNEWMRRFTEDPKGFEAEFEMVGRFLAQQASGQEPTYGHNCTAYMFHLLAELNGKQA